jgi:hypothetical protein
MAVRLQQFKHESESWKKMLEFMQQENVHLKTRLAEVLKKDVKEDFLEKAEYFQSCFLHIDERIAFLRSDIAEINKMVLMELFHDGHLKVLIQKQKKLREDMRMEDDVFKKLKFEFDRYLMESL